MNLINILAKNVPIEEAWTPDQNPIVTNTQNLVQAQRGNKWEGYLKSTSGKEVQEGLTKQWDESKKRWLQSGAEESRWSPRSELFGLKSTSSIPKITALPGHAPSVVEGRPRMEMAREFSLLSSAISLENHHGNDPLHCWKMDRELRSVHSLITIGKAVLYGIYYRRPRDLDQFGIIDRLAWEEKYKQLEERRTAN